MNCSNFDIGLRRVASLQSAGYSVSNYATAISAEEMAGFRETYPLDPNSGALLKAEI